MRIDLVALDLDGTLLGPDEDISRANRDAVARTLESGVRVVIVTGRGTDVPIKISHDLGLNMPVICCHGALVKDFHANRSLVHIPIPLPAARTIVEVAGAFGLPTVVYVEERFWYLPGTPHSVRVLLGPEAEEEDSFDGLLVRAGAPTFIRLFGGAALDVVQRRLADLPIGFFHFDPVVEHDEVAIVSREANKRNALMRLCADFQIPAERVLAVGDSRSDIPMLRWAGVGVAMGNAGDDVKAAADFVTATNADDGVAHTLERFLRLERRKLA
jgi:hydroxymethylpyrimidine pyrophosphatase-like HAD family hydrolase